MKLNSKRPKVVHSKIIDGRLVLTLDWYGIETSHSIVTRTPNGYQYENVGLMKRELPHCDEILDEVECSESLMKKMKELPVLNID